MWWTKQVDGFRGWFHVKRSNGILRTGLLAGDFSVTVRNPIDSLSSTPTVSESGKPGLYLFDIPSTFLLSGGIGEYGAVIEVNTRLGPSSSPHVRDSVSNVLRVSQQDFDSLPVPPDAYQIADAVWTTQASGYFNNDGAFGQVLGFTLAANATITNSVDGYTIETTLNEVDNYWDNHQAVVYDISTGNRVVRNVTSYLQASGTITFSQTLPFTPVVGDLFMIITRSPATGTSTATVDNNAIATAVWNKPIASHTAEGTFGRTVGFTSAIETTVTGGTASTIATGLTQPDNFWDEHQIVVVDASSGEKVVRNVATYTNAGGAITFNAPLPFSPAVSDPVFILTRSSSTTGTATVDAYAVASAVWEANLADHQDTDTFGSLQFGATDGYSVIPDVPTNTNVTVSRGNFANIMVNGVGDGSIRFVTKGLANHSASTNKLTISVQKRTISISIDAGQNFFVLPIGVHTLSIGWIKKLLLSGQGTWEVIASFT